jgi:murein DD-endopeptidase MepM/ murein hydrolase activator NlpD
MCALALAMATFVASSGPAAASAGSDRAQITQLEQQISAQGSRVESLVGQYNQVQARVGALDLQITDDQALLASDHQAETAASRVLQRMAVDAYVSSGLNSSTLMLFSGTSSITTTFEQNDYLGAVNGKWNAALTALHLNQARTQDAGRALRSEQAQATATLHQLSSAHDAANAAISSDEAILSRVNGNLRTILAAATQQREAEQLAAERRLAAVAPAPLTPLPFTTPTSVTPSPPSSSPPPTVSSPPPSQPPPSSTAGYSNPFRAVSALSPERIDQGVDYSGFGPVYAVGNGVVLSTVNGGWPGGTFIAYQLSGGPAAGLVVYVGEDVEPAVQVGASVTSSTVLGQMYAGPDGIETGWADATALGNTMARTYQQFSGSNSTAFGDNFSQFLQSVGAPGGVLQNNPPTGQLPQTWPRW